MRVIVCGAGIAGLALAGRLGALGHEVTLLERAPGPRRQGYLMDFFGPGYDAAEATGVLAAIRERGHAVTEVSYLDPAGRRRAGLPFARFAESRRGRLVSILRPDLEAALREHLPAAVDLRHGVEPVAVEEGADRVRVTLAGGSDLDADLLVGADGIHSAVRRLVFGPERRYLRPLGFHTAAWTFVDPQVHAELRGRFCLTDTIDRQVGLYGLPGDRVAAFTVHRTADPALPVDPRAAVRERYRDLGWVVPRVLDRCPPGPQVYYDQVAQIVVPRWSGRRVTLLGDAGYAVSLLAGQGASMAVAGAYVLADRLDRVGPVGGVGAALAGYEALWRPVVTDVQRTARRGTRWFLPGSRTDLRIRRAALRLAGLPGVDRVVVGAVAGPSSGLVRELAGASGRGRPRPGHRAGSTRCPRSGALDEEVGWRRTSSTWCG